MVGVIVFELAGQRYGLPLRDVDEVLRAVSTVHLPKAPRIVEGVVDLRGVIVPVMDIRSRFGLPTKRVDPADQLVVGRTPDRIVAIRVDRVIGLVQVDPRDIEDASKVTPHAEYVMGIAKLADGLVLIHDLRTFLSRAESEALADLLSEQGST